MRLVLARSSAQPRLLTRYQTKREGFRLPKTILCLASAIRVARSHTFGLGQLLALEQSTPTHLVYYRQPALVLLVIVGRPQRMRF
jgi:hypothetical protein